MKAKISQDLMKRIKCAADNGSVVANDLLNAIKVHRDMSEETEKKANYFDSKRKVAGYDTRKIIRIVVTCCRKDVTNPNFPDYGNPQAPYFPENRDDITLKEFALLFKDVRERTYSDDDWRYFDSAARVGSKVTVRIGKTMADFVKAYSSCNYIGLSESDQSTLHGSCMRHLDVVRNVADFYVNFAGARILIAENGEGEVCARALLWDAVDVNNKKKIRFIDRIYTAFDGFLLHRMIDAAKDAGANFRKTYNDYCHKKQFTPLDDTFGYEVGSQINMSVGVSVPSAKLHKKGAPYVDTMSYLMYDENTKKFVLSNEAVFDEVSYCVADLTSTSGWASRAKNICPICGHVTDNYDACGDCRNELVTQTLFGSVMVCKTKTYKGMQVPAKCMNGNKPTDAFMAYITLARIIDSNNRL